MDCGQQLEFGPPEPPHKDVSQTFLVVTQKTEMSKVGKEFNFCLLVQSPIYDKRKFSISS